MSPRSDRGRGNGARRRPSHDEVTRLLRTALATRFKSGIEDFTEVGTGAGRVDLFVLLRGGLRLILELKVCGAPYAEAYARDGVAQLEHYMHNKKTALGYLVVFDGRQRDFGKGLETPLVTKAGTIFVRFVDVRAEITRAKE